MKLVHLMNYYALMESGICLRLRPFLATSSQVSSLSGRYLVYLRCVREPLTASLLLPFE